MDAQTDSFHPHLLPHSASATWLPLHHLLFCCLFTAIPLKPLPLEAETRTEESGCICWTNMYNTSCWSHSHTQLTAMYNAGACRLASEQLISGKGAATATQDCSASQFFAFVCNRRHFCTIRINTPTPSRHDTFTATALICWRNAPWLIGTGVSVGKASANAVDNGLPGEGTHSLSLSRSLCRRPVSLSLPLCVLTCGNKGTVTECTGVDANELATTHWLGHWSAQFCTHLNSQFFNQITSTRLFEWIRSSSLISITWFGGKCDRRRRSCCSVIAAMRTAQPVSYPFTWSLACASARAFSSPLCLFPEDWAPLPLSPLRPSASIGDPRMLFPWMLSGRIQWLRTREGAFHSSCELVPSYIAFFCHRLSAHIV